MHLRYLFPVILPGAIRYMEQCDTLKRILEIVREDLNPKIERAINVLRAKGRGTELECMTGEVQRILKDLPETGYIRLPPFISDHYPSTSKLPFRS